MSTEEALAEKVLAEKVLADHRFVEQALAKQKLEPPVPAKLPLDARLKNKKRQNYCDFAAFWIFGLANNFGYVCMLSAAQDIMSKHATEQSGSVNGSEPVCRQTLDRQRDSCGGMPLGSVLLADVLPLFVVKCAWPFIMHRMSFGFQHTIAVILQVVSYLVVAFSDSIVTSLIGVVFASLGSGIGEVCYLALASHYSKHIISSWSSGTGGAGLVGALAYAALTEPHLLDLSPQTTLLTMLVIPAVCFVTYFSLLTPAPTIYPVMKLTKPTTWIVFNIRQHHEQLVSTLSQKGSFASTNTSSDESAACPDGQYRELRETVTSADVSITVNTLKPTSFKSRCLLMLPTMKFMIPLAVTYFAQYTISQGLAEFSIFDCKHAFNLDIKSQYRWYQVISQLGVFITRSSVSLFQLPVFLLISLPFLEIINAAAFVADAYTHYIPHLWVSFAMMLMQGLIAGASYVNTLYRIHKTVHPDVKEFSLAITAAWNAAGIAGAGIFSIPLHAYFCSRYTA